MQSFPVRMLGYALFGLAALLGPSALTIFALFLFFGSLDLVNLTMDETEKLWVDACLCMAFFIQHSTMIRKSFRKRLVRFLPEAYSGAFYTIVSGLVLVLLVVFWQQSAYSLATAHNVVRWFLRALYFLSIGGFFWGVKALGFFDPFGLKADFAHLSRVRLVPRALIVRGPYRYVRHPLYLFVLLMIWSGPDLTADRLLFNVLCTAWIIVGVCWKSEIWWLSMAIRIATIKVKFLCLFQGRIGQDTMNEEPISEDVSRGRKVGQHK